MWPLGSPGEKSSKLAMGPRGTGRLHHCFKSSREELEVLRTYCKADIERLCPNVEPGGGRIKACLMVQKEQMLVGCAQALEKLKK
jgi:hypothetical protein